MNFAVGGRGARSGGSSGPEEEESATFGLAAEKGDRGRSALARGRLADPGLRETVDRASMAKRGLAGPR